MDFDLIKNSKNSLKVYLPKVLVGVAVVFAAGTLVKGIGYAMTSAKISRIVESAGETEQGDTANKSGEAIKKRIDELKKKNIFVMVPAKQNPVKQVQGIFGKEALINGKWYKAGDKVGDAEIVAVEATFVKVKWGGSEKDFAPIAAASGNVQTAPKKVEKKRPAAVKARVARREARKEKAEKNIEQLEHDPLGWMGVTLSAKARRFIMKQWESASDEDKEEAKEEWNNMSDEEKEQAISQLESMPE